MRFLSTYFASTLLILYCLNSQDLKIANKTKKFDKMACFVSPLDTTTFAIIILKDTLYFGNNRKVTIKEPGAKLTSTIWPSDKFAKMSFFDDTSLLMTLNLQILEVINDTVALYDENNPIIDKPPYGIILYHTCISKSLEINNFEKVKQYAYLRKLLSKLLDCYQF
jgi:hypothetical protein